MLRYDSHEEAPLEKLPFLAHPSSVAQRTSGHQQGEQARTATTGATIPPEKGIDKPQLPSVSRPRNSINPSGTGISQPDEAASPAETSQRSSFQTEKAGRSSSLPRPRHTAILKPARVSGNAKKAKTAAPKAKSQTPTGRNTAPLNPTRRVTRSMVAQGIAPAPTEIMSPVERSRREPAKGPPRKPVTAKGKETSTAPEEPLDEPSTPPPPKPPSKASGKRKRQEEPEDEEPQDSPRMSGKGGKRKRQQEPEDEDQQDPPGRSSKATAAAAAPPPPPPSKPTTTNPDSASIPALPIPSVPNKATSRSRRPKAADFLDTDDASEEGRSSAAATTTQSPAQQRQTSLSQARERDAVPAHPDTPPPTTPPIPWELYGLDDVPEETQGRSEVGLGTIQTGTGPRKGGGPSGLRVTEGKADMDKGKGDRKGASAKPGKGISRRAVLSPPLGGAASGFAELKGSTASATDTRKQRRDLAAGVEEVVESEEDRHDPHDPSMAEDYIPFGPGPMPRLPKGARQRQKKQRPSPLGEDSTAESEAVPAVAQETPPAVAGPPESPVPLQLALPAATAEESIPEADPAIWNIEPGSMKKQISRHQKRDAPARPGNIYCEVCFRDDCARWIRIRDGVFRVLHLLGGDPAVAELCRLAQQVEKAEDEAAYRDMINKEEGRRRKRLRSPPPPAHQPSGSEAESEGGKASRWKSKRTRANASAKKLIVLPDGETIRTLFHDHPSDVMGLALLRMVAENHASSLSRSAGREVDRILEALRQDIGLSVSQLKKLTAQLRGLLMATGTEADSASVASGQRRGRARSSRRAMDVEDSIASTPPETGTLAQLERQLGVDLPSDLLLKRIGDKVAQTRWSLEKKAGAATDRAAPTGRKRAREAPSQAATTSDHHHHHHQQQQSDIDNDIDSRPTKRRKPLPKEDDDDDHTTPASLTTQPPLTPHQPPYPFPPPSSTVPSFPHHHHHHPFPLPCVYCAESDASNRKAARRPYPRERDDAPPPWAKPLMWAFGLAAAATRVVTAGDFFGLVAARGGAVTAEVDCGGGGGGGEDAGEEGRAAGSVCGAGLRFMVDVTGGETRVVLVEMRSVFEAVWAAGGGAGLKRARFEPPVAVWEKWKDGTLEGYSFV